jgi:hypothetical protein
MVSMTSSPREILRARKLKTRIQKTIVNKLAMNRKAQDDQNKGARIKNPEFRRKTKKIDFI